MTCAFADRSAIRQQERVASTLRAAAYFPLFSVPNPTTATVPLTRPGDGSLIGMRVHESLHRFIMQTGSSAHPALGACNRVGETLATIRIDWRVVPDDFVAA